MSVRVFLESVTELAQAGVLEGENKRTGVWQESALFTQPTAQDS